MKSKFQSAQGSVSHYYIGFISVTSPTLYPGKVLFDSIQECLISRDIHNGQEYGSLSIYVNFLCECECVLWC